MNRSSKFWGVMVMVLLFSTYAMASQTPRPQPENASPLQSSPSQDQVKTDGTSAPQNQGQLTTDQTVELELSGQDAITAADAGGGHMHSGTLVYAIIIVLAVVGLAALL